MSEPNVSTEVAAPVAVASQPETVVVSTEVAAPVAVASETVVSQPIAVVASKPKRTRKVKSKKIVKVKSKVKSKKGKAKKGKAKKGKAKKGKAKKGKVEVGKAQRGRPILFKGAQKVHIVSVIRKHGLTAGREVLAKEKIKISLPTLGRLAAEAKIKLYRGRPAKAA